MYDDQLLHPDWRPEPEGDQAQPKWNGRKNSEAEQRFQTEPQFFDN